VGFEPTISAGERPQTYALDWAATGTGNRDVRSNNIVIYLKILKGRNLLRDQEERRNNID
jgi:hypothetical protein